VSAASRVDLSLVVALRGRAEHLSVLLAWLARERRMQEAPLWDLFVVEGASNPSAAQALHGLEWARHIFVRQDGPFCKAELLNRGAELSVAKYVAPLDVDLLPAHGVLEHQLELARSSPRCVVSGYRVMLLEQPAADPLPQDDELVALAWSQGVASLGPEERPTARLKYLLRQDRFGICPFFPRERLLAAGGWDEQYVGWGAEDEDILYRLGTSLTMVRAYDLLYFHMPHGQEPDWNVPELTAANRLRFSSKRMLRHD
jgi:hypothetical protein